MVAVDDIIAAYLPIVKKLAWKYTGSYGAEYEDLVQEGMIAVWNSVKRENEPMQVYIQWRMRNWVTFTQKQKAGQTDGSWRDDDLLS